MAATLITPAELIAELPPLSCFAGPVMDAIVADTGLMVRLDVWGDCQSQAHKWLSAHFVTRILDPGNAVGQLASITIDKLSESYAVGAFEDAELSSTEYGRFYMSLLKNQPEHSVVRSANLSAPFHGGSLP